MIRMALTGCFSGNLMGTSLTPRARSTPSSGRSLADVGFHVTDLQCPQIALGRPGEGAVDGGGVLGVGAVDGAEHQGAVLDGAGEGADLVHRPGQRHAAGPANAPEG